MPKGNSLHIGVNSVNPAHYAGWSGPLEACEADARSMQEIAVSLGYQSSLMPTEKATRSEVIRSIKRAAEVLEGGDIFFLSFSGHGGQVPDASGDETDLKDETWCLYDGKLIDDELANLWTRFGSGVRILVFSDSCHSGTATRLADQNQVDLDSLGRIVQISSGNGAEVATVYRAMPRKFARKTYTKNRNTYDEIIGSLPNELSETAARVRLISGCKDEQL